MINEAPQGKWFKSGRSEASNACVEVCLTESGVGVRDSKNPGGPELWFTGEEWDSFLSSDTWKS